MISNVGAKALKRNKHLGFNVQDESSDYSDMKGTVMYELKKAFRQEFFNRIDEIIVFHLLEKKHIQEIVTLMVNQLVNRLKEQEIELHITEGAISAIADKGFDREYGARQLRRAGQQHIDDRLSEDLLKGAM